MKILFLIDKDYNETKGGVQVHLQQIKEILENEHKVYIIKSPEVFHPKHYKNTFFSRIKKNIDKVIFLIKKFAFALGISYESRKFISLSLKKISKINPDIIHIHHLINFPLNFPLKLKNYIITLHDYWFICPRITLLFKNRTPCNKNIFWCPICYFDIYGKFLILLFYILFLFYFAYRRYILKKILAKAKILISPSKFLIKKYKEYEISGNFYHLPHGIKYFQIPEKRKKEKITFGFIGTISPHKGFFLFEKAVEILKKKGYDFKAIAYGENLQSISPNIEYRGIFTREKIGEVFSQIDVLIFPSIWFENCPLTLLEAKYAKVPVIASQIGAIPEFIKDNAEGFLFKYRNACDLSRKMEMFIKNKKLKVEMKIKKPLNINTFIKELMKIYQWVKRC